MAVVSHVARQPLLLAYLVAGFAIGPHGFQWITDAHSISTISEIGLSLLLFMIGLEIDLKKMLSAGRVITITAAAQILGCVLLGWLVFEWIGPAQNRLEAVYLGVAAAMSSTVIIVKILYDKRELETLAGRVTLGVLVLQDIATILFLADPTELEKPRLRSAWRMHWATSSCCWRSPFWPAGMCCRRCSAPSHASRNWCWSARWPGAWRWPVLPTGSACRTLWARSSPA